MVSRVAINNISTKPFHNPMKNILDLLLDGITFKDLAGKRQPRTFAVMALIVVVLLAALFIGSVWERNAMMSAVEATALPVQIIMQPSSTPEAAITQAAEPPLPGCPTNPDDWSLADVFISENYKLIQPACVYDGLAHSVAWALAIRQGYARADAAELLGFDEMPMKQIDQVTALGNTGDPQTVPLSFTPPHPRFMEWRIDAGGNPSVSYALRGCFRTSSVTGNTVETWGGDYPVICVVVEDAENTHVVYALDGHIFTAEATPTRSYLLFGYSGEGLWSLLGARENPKTPIDDPAKFANDRLTIATLYDSQPWDAEWLKARYGLAPRPLPESWQTFEDQAEMQAILGILNSDQGGQ